MSLQFRKVLRPSVEFCSIEEVLMGGNTLLAILKPSTFAFSPGIEEVEIETSSGGIVRPVLRYESRQAPELSLTFPGTDVNTLEFQTGRKFAIATRNTFFGGQDFLTASATIAGASSSTQLGFGVAANVAGALATVNRDNQRIKLTYDTDFAAFNAALNDRFAVGANGARKYSTNLLTENATVNFQIPYTASILSLSALPLNGYKINLGLLDIDNEVVNFTAYSVQPILNTQVDLSAASVSIPFRINASGCGNPYDFQFTGQQVFCS